jgi:DMSO reductase anchor subunit
VQKAQGFDGRLVQHPRVLSRPLLAGMQGGVALLAGAFAMQYLGLLAERWYFFAQANHPQNLYYQSIA